MADSSDRMRDHDYDGIRELDNDLPRWWLWLFCLTIVWGIGYLLYFHILDIGYSSSDMYRSEMNPDYVRPSDAEAAYFGVLARYRSPLAATDRATASTSKRRRPVMLSRESDTTTYMALTDEASLAAGRAVFEKSCASCHGQLAEGDVGPNLTDDYWIHGADESNIVKSIRYGFPTKGMVPWSGTLSPGAILQTAGYVLSLRGSNPPNAKAPEGEPVGE